MRVIPKQVGLGSCSVGMGEIQRPVQGFERWPHMVCKVFFFQQRNQSFKTLNQFDG